MGGLRSERDAITVSRACIMRSGTCAAASNRTALDPLWKDVFLFHWRGESQRAILDEFEWQREDARNDDSQRDRAVDDLIGLAGAVDGAVQMQAKADAAFGPMINAALGARARRRWRPSQEEA